MSITGKILSALLVIAVLTPPSTSYAMSVAEANTAQKSTAGKLASDTTAMNKAKTNLTTGQTKITTTSKTLTSAQASFDKSCGANVAVKAKTCATTLQTALNNALKAKNDADAAVPLLQKAYDDAVKLVAESKKTDDAAKQGILVAKNDALKAAHLEAAEKEAKKAVDAFIAQQAAKDKASLALFKKSYPDQYQKNLPLMQSVEYKNAVEASAIRAGADAFTKSITELEAKAPTGPYGAKLAATLPPLYQNAAEKQMLANEAYAELINPGTKAAKDAAEAKRVADIFAEIAKQKAIASTAPVVPAGAILSSQQIAAEKAKTLAKQDYLLKRESNKSRTLSLIKSTLGEDAYEGAIKYYNSADYTADATKAADAVGEAAYTTGYYASAGFTDQGVINRTQGAADSAISAITDKALNAAIAGANQPYTVVRNTDGTTEKIVKGDKIIQDNLPIGSTKIDKDNNVSVSIPRNPDCDLPTIAVFAGFGPWSEWEGYDADASELACGGEFTLSDDDCDQ